MKITACPICGSRKIFQGRLKEGVLTGYTSRYVCRKCGYQGSPIIFDSEKEYKKFLESIEDNKTIDKNESELAEMDISKMSDKEKEVMSFLNEIKNDVENDEDFEEDKSKLLKNPVTALGFALFIVGILSSLISFYFTLVLIFGGIFLFIVGIFGPEEKLLKNEEYKKKLDKIPKIAGFLLFFNGLINGILFSGLAFYIYIWENNIGSLPINNRELFSSIEGFETIFILILAVEAIFCLFMIIGGIFSLIKKRWGISALGSILGLFLIPFPFGINVIISFICLILIAYSRYNFN